MRFRDESNAKRVLVFVIVLAPGVSIHEMSKSNYASLVALFCPGNAIAKKQQGPEKARNGDYNTRYAATTKKESQPRVPF